MSRLRWKLDANNRVGAEKPNVAKKADICSWWWQTNYGNVKSRLFSYETASSPNSSREGSRGYSSDVEIRRTHTKDRASLEANNYSPPHNYEMSRCPDSNMEPSHRMKSSRVESARSTFASEPQNDDTKFGYSSISQFRTFSNIQGHFGVFCCVHCSMYIYFLSGHVENAMILHCLFQTVTYFLCLPTCSSTIQDSLLILHFLIRIWFRTEVTYHIVAITPDIWLLKFCRRSSAVRHMNTQKKPWVRYIRKSKPVVVEEKVGGLDLGRLPKIKVRCNPKENIKDPFQLPNKPQEEPSLWGHNIQSTERLKKKGSHSYRLVHCCQ